MYERGDAAVLFLFLVVLIFQIRLSVRLHGCPFEPFFVAEVLSSLFAWLSDCWRGLSNF